jgi:DNA ligase-associated metallophosphoesterase
MTTFGSPPAAAVRGAGAALCVNGATLAADVSGALWWPAERLLAVADLHLEKGSSFARRGTLLPPYDSAATLARLQAAVERYRPQRLICLGDSFHDRHASARLAEGDVAVLRMLTQACDWIWIRGNHDPAPPAGLGGRTGASWTQGALLFRHAAVRGAAPGEVSGHLHPKATIARHGKRLGGRCFVTDGARLILPAFGSYAGGLDVLDPAIAGLFPDGRFEVHVVGRERLHRLTAAQLMRDRVDWSGW